MAEKTAHWPVFQIAKLYTCCAADIEDSFGKSISPAAVTRCRQPSLSATCSMPSRELLMFHDPHAAKGILVGVLGVLAVHYGYSR